MPIRPRPAHSHRIRSCPNATPSQQGQALVEFLTIALALIPLFLLMPMVAKYMDIAHAAQASSRYAAFESTVHHGSSPNGSTPSGQLADEVQRRFFSNLDAPVKTLDAAGDFEAHRNRFWRGPTGTPLIKSMQDITVARTDSTAPKDTTLGLAQKMQLANTALVRSDVSVVLVKLPDFLQSYKPLDQIELRIARSTSVLPNAWTAANPAAVRETVGRASSIAPAVSKLQALVDVVVEPFELLKNPAPQFNRLDRWDDVVPADRLVRDRP